MAAAAGDNRVLAPALVDLGRAQAKAHKQEEALRTLRRALAVAGAEAGVRVHAYEALTEVYRESERLGELIKELEAAQPGDRTRLALLGSLYEETGDATKAIATYRRALAQDARNIDLHVKVVRLLQAIGDLDGAIAEYEGLLRSAPNNPSFVFEMCDALIQRGDRARALRLLGELLARSGGDEEVLSRLGEFYARIGEGALSLKVLTKLAETHGEDPSHLADLGDRYYQDGNTPLAVATWKRILNVVTPKARAYAALGDVYLEHEMVADAIVALREALGLDAGNLGYKKSLATALEHAKNYREAQLLWQELMVRSRETKNPALARESRTHLVTLWGLTHALEQQLGVLAAAFAGAPPDVDAGRTLAEVQLHLHRTAETEATLRRVLALAPGDAESYLALERVLVQQAKLEEAIAVLDKLASVDPKRARELYQRMAQYALQIYKDDDAIRYAARAVELNPDDAEGHRRLGEMYRSRQDGERAIREFRAAIGKNERLYLVYFELADLLLAKGDSTEADRLFRRVLRAAPDEELVARAARLSMQINLGKGTLESLEQDLLPLAIDNPQKSIYRRLLVEIYENLTFGLVQRIRHGAEADAADARAKLSRIGQRAVKPLLDALAGGDEGQQRLALEVLAYVQNKNAAPALFSFATGSAETSLRVKAMLACGALADPAMLPRYRRLLSPEAAGRSDGEAPPSDAVAVAATWGLVRLGSREALPLLRGIATSGTPEMRAIALLGIGALHDTTQTALVARIARSSDSGNVARAAAAYVLADLGASTEEPTLLALADGGEALPRELALIALARLGEKKPAAIAAMASAVFAGADGDSARSRETARAVSRAGASSLMLLASGTRAAAHVRTPASLPEGASDIESMLSQLVPDNFTAEERALAASTFSDAIRAAAVSAFETSSHGARAVLAALGDGQGALVPFAGPAGTGPGQGHAKELLDALIPHLTSLAGDPDPLVRTRALILLSRVPGETALAAVIAGTRDPSEAVQRAALSALGRSSSPAAVDAAARALLGGQHFAVRVLAAEALGRLGAAGGGDDVARVLRDAATRDTFALVREAALRALAGFDPAGARRLAQEMADRDAEPRVRDLARAVAQGGTPPQSEGDRAHP